MKINKQRLVELIKEELFYREFYRTGGDLNEVAPVISGRVNKLASELGKVASEIEKIAKSDPQEFAQLAELLKTHESFMNMVLGMGFQPPMQ